MTPRGFFKVVPLVVLLLVCVALLPGCPLEPKPTPPPTPTPKPPIEGCYSCGAPPDLSGVVSVAHSTAGQYIVVLTNRTERIQTLMGTQGVEIKQNLGDGYAAQIAASSIATLLSDPNVDYIQMDGLKSVTPIPPLAPAALLTWGLDRIDQRDLPLDQNYSPGSCGTGVHVFVIDTGITPDPRFGNPVSHESFTAYGTSWHDDNGHGTHVAGTIASKEFGVAPCVILHAVKVLRADGSGADSAVIRGIDFVVQWKLTHPGVPVVANLSLGGGAAPALDGAICHAMSVGVVFALAAGNEDNEACEVSPARVIESVTVGATDMQDRQAPFSNHGLVLDLHAPGVDITSTQPGGGRATWSGTSMATPHVAGALALILEKNPAASPTLAREMLAAAATKGKVQGVVEHGQNALPYVRD